MSREWHSYMYTLPGVTWIASGNLQFCRASSAQCSVMTQTGGTGWWWKGDLRGRRKIVSQFLLKMYAHLINHVESFKSLLIQTAVLFCVLNIKGVYEICFWKHNEGSQHVSCPVSCTHAFCFQICCWKHLSCKNETSRMLKYQEKFVWREKHPSRRNYGIFSRFTVFPTETQ